ncbi:MAG: hypothetical protein K6A65_08625 [Succinivibrionaceae bacterium]|nr:hypothetical protein [Succinivibrionaceae bacterium]
MPSWVFAKTPRRPRLLLAALALMWCEAATAVDMKGEVVATAQFSDTGGSFTVLLTKEPDTTTMAGGEALVSAAIHAYCVKNGQPPALLFKAYDFIDRCINYPRLEFVGGAPFLTDLDHDGQQEVWVAYYKGCHGDVSPDEFKVLMYRGGKKHALRGNTEVHVDGHVLGGDYKLDKSFSSLPPPFAAHAKEIFSSYAR